MSSDKIQASSFNSMADNYRNNQFVNDYKSNYNTYLTNIKLENHGEYFVMIVNHIQKVLNLLLYVDLIVIVLHL